MSNITDITYKGTVSVKLQIGNKVVAIQSKNTGTDYLKQAICKFLSGNYGGNPDIPQRIELRKRVEVAGGGERWSNILNEEIFLSGKTFLKTTDELLGIHDNWVARFTAAIPHSALMEAVLPGDNDNYRLYLVGAFDDSNIQERYHDLAYIAVDAADVARITSGTQALVEWSMQILQAQE